MKRSSLGNHHFRSARRSREIKKKKTCPIVPLSKSPSKPRKLSTRISIHTDVSIFFPSSWIRENSLVHIRKREIFYFFSLFSETEGIGGGGGGVNEAENFTRGEKHMAPRCCVRVVRFRVFAKVPQTPSYFFNVPSRRY